MTAMKVTGGVALVLAVLLTLAAVSSKGKSSRLPTSEDVGRLASAGERSAAALERMAAALDDIAEQKDDSRCAERRLEADIRRDARKSAKASR